MLEMLTMRPHLAAVMYFCAARLMRNGPRRFTAMTVFQSSSVSLNSMLSRVMPALLTSTVGSPSSATTRSTAAVHRLGVGDVHRDAHGPPPVGHDGLGGRLRPGLVEVEDRHGEAVGRKPPREEYT